MLLILRFEITIKENCYYIFLIFIEYCKINLKVRKDIGLNLQDFLTFNNNGIKQCTKNRNKEFFECTLKIKTSIFVENFKSLVTTRE